MGDVSDEDEVVVDRKMRKMKIEEVEDEEVHEKQRKKSREYDKKEEPAVALLGLDEGQGEDEKPSQAGIANHA